MSLFFLQEWPSRDLCKQVPRSSMLMILNTPPLADELVVGGSAKLQPHNGVGRDLRGIYSIGSLITFLPTWGVLDAHSLGFVCVCTPKRPKLRELAELSWETHFKFMKNQKSVSLTSNMMKTTQVLWQAYAWLRATRMHVVASRNFISMELFRGCHVSRGRCRILRFFKPPSSKTHPKISSTDVSFNWPWGQCPLIGCIYRWPWRVG